MGIFKAPLYIRLDKDGNGGIFIGAAGGSVPGHISNTLVVLKVDLEIDESLFNPAFDTQTVISVLRPMMDVSTVVAGLRSIEKRAKEL